MGKKPLRSQIRDFVLYYVGALVERRSRMVIPEEVGVKLIDVAQHIADLSMGPARHEPDNIAGYRKDADNWTELFDRSYKAILKTVVAEEGEEED